MKLKRIHPWIRRESKHVKKNLQELHIIFHSFSSKHADLTLLRKIQEEKREDGPELVSNNVRNDGVLSEINS